MLQFSHGEWRYHLYHLRFGPVLACHLLACIACKIRVSENKINLIVHLVREEENTLNKEYQIFVMRSIY